MVVPLSDREQRILEEIERTLYEEDPAFVRDVSSATTGSAHLRRAKLGGAAFVGGLFLLFAFFATRMLVLGLAAFGLMVAGLVLLTGALRGLAATATPAAAEKRLLLADKLSQWESAVRRRYKKR